MWIKTVGHHPGLYGVRRQTKRDAALAETLVLRWIRHKQKPKRRRASLVAAFLHNATGSAVNSCITSSPPARVERSEVGQVCCGELHIGSK